ncbi:MAG: hypothetical protein H7Z41_13935 [Cytophagales bacterium]|nr:hypothetical protein [Armatimonadota bacterium]
MISLSQALKSRLDAVRVRQPLSSERTSERETISGGPPTPLQEMQCLHSSLYRLANVCADAVTKAVLHFQPGDLWLVGTMPTCAVEADLAETQGRSYLAHSQLTEDQIDSVSRILKDIADLRAVARCARHAAQISWLLRGEAESDESLRRLIVSVGDPAATVARKSVVVIAAKNPQAAAATALLYRQVDTARQAAELALRDQPLVERCSIPQVRMSRAAIWYMTICGESMARLAARAAQIPKI